MLKTTLLLIGSFLLLQGKTQVPGQLISDLQKDHSSVKKLNHLLDDYIKKGLLIAAVKAYRWYPPFADDHIIYEIEYADKSNTKGYTKAVNLILFAKKDKIVYLCLLNRHYAPHPNDTLFAYIDTLFSRKVLTSHTGQKSPAWTINDLYLDKPDIYGVSWGMYLSYEREIFVDMENVFKAVLSRDSTLLINYCHSFSSEQIAYGATGLYIWQKVNGPLDKKAQSLLHSIQQAKQKISWSLGGCIVETKPMSTVLADDFLDDIYKDFVKYWGKMKQL